MLQNLPGIGELADDLDLFLRRQNAGQALAKKLMLICYHQPNPSIPISGVSLQRWPARIDHEFLLNIKGDCSADPQQQRRCTHRFCYTADAKYKSITAIGLTEFALILVTEKFFPEMPRSPFYRGRSRKNPPPGRSCQAARRGGDQVMR
jgi:hypothetical protein